MKHNKISEILAFKIEAYDYFYFKDQIKKNFSQSTIVRFNPHSNAKIVYNYEDIGDGKEFNFSSYYIKNRNIYYLFYPIIFIVDFFKIYFLIRSILNKNNYKYFFTDNTYACVAFKLLNFKKKIKVVYASHDWLAGTKGKGIWSYIGKNIIFILFDYFSCKNSYKILNHTTTVQNLRNLYWKKNDFNQILYYPKIFENKFTETSKNKRDKLLFLGLVRDESGLVELLNKLKSLNKIKSNIKIKIVGIPDQKIKYLMKKEEFSKYIVLEGFSKRVDFEKLFSDCFCGLCLVTKNQSYTNNTIPSKIIDYIQYNLPILATDNLGYISDIINKNSLGLLVDKNLSNINSNIEYIFKNQNLYKENIKEYLLNYDYTDIKEIFK